MRHFRSLCVSVALWALTPDEALAQVKAPELVTFVPASYPEAAQAAGIEGVVSLELRVDESGKVIEARVVQPAGFGLDEAAQAAALQFVFTPATQDGVAVSAVIPYRYRFSLRPQGKKTSPAGAPLDMGTGTPPASALGDTNLISVLPSGAIRGVLVEKGSRLPIANAQVLLLEGPSGASQPASAVTPKLLKEGLSDEKGSFSFENLPAGGYELRVIATDYEAFTTVESLPESGALSLTLRLSPTVSSGYGLVVRGEKEEEEVTRYVVSAEELAKLPGTQGDVLKGLRNLPGFARAPFGGGLIVVRGSAPQDTQTFLNGLPVPIIYHFGGLTSVVSGNLLSKIDFLPGLFSARYGRGMGGIIDAETVPGKSPIFSGSADTDLFDTDLYLQGPIGEKGASFAVAGRRSYIDQILPRVIPEDAGVNLTAAPRYWDYQATVGGDLLGGKAQVIAFGSDDVLDLLLNSSEFGEQFFSTFTRFHRVQAIWQKQMGDNLERRVAISTGPTKLNFSAPPNITFDLSTLLTAARVDWTWSKSEKFALVYGLDAQSNSFQVDVLFPAGNNQVIQNSVKGTSADVAGYVEARYSPRDNVQVISGLRSDYFGGTDSVTLDPRFLVRWDMDVNTSIKGGAGLFHQDPQPQEVDPIFGNPNLSAQYSTQYVLGLEKRLWENRIDIDTSVFYKGLSNLVSQNGTGNTLSEITTNDGEGRVYGFEFLLRYPPSARFFGWVAYSLSRAERRDSKEDDYFLFDFDQTHVLTLLGSYKLGRDFSFGGRVRYATGNPQTPVVGAIFDADSGSYFPVSGARNSERVPAFSQVDLRLDKDWRSSSWKMGAYIEVLNVLNRKNPEGSFYNFDFTQQQFFNSLPFLPTIGVRGEF